MKDRFAVAGALHSDPLQAQQGHTETHVFLHPMAGGPGNPGRANLTHCSTRRCTRTLQQRCVTTSFPSVQVHDGGGGAGTKPGWLC